MMLRRISGFAVLGLALLVGTGPATTTLHAAPGFEGRWNVTIFTQSGPCDQSYLVPLEVSAGQIIYRGTVGLSGGGTVSANGAVRTNFSRQGDTLSATGRLSGNGGSGTWTAPQRNCRGTWTASRG
jgi:hypothetical protein